MHATTDDGRPGLDEITTMFRTFAATTQRRAPLYARLAASIADDPDLSGLLLAAPPTQRQPVLLFACVHDVLLRRPDDPLAAHYPNLTESPLVGDDPIPSFRAFVDHHRDELLTLLASRSTQTNEIGRCAVLLPAFGLLAREVGPLAHVDVGASAGLNLLADRYAYHYEPGGDVGVGPVRLPCGTRGDVPVPSTLPPVAARAGLDRSPVDVRDPDAARWLEACVWPDQADRFARLRAAIGMARETPPSVRLGDATTDAAPLAAELAASGHPVVTTTWVLNYLTGPQRTAFLAALDELGGRRDLSWLALESPRLVPELPLGSGAPPGEVSDDPDDTTGPVALTDQTVLALVRWRDGVRSVDRLGTAHPHGYWLHWSPTAPR